jgi:hypothetical protein
MYDAPIMMYGPRGWADLDDYRLVRNDSETEAAARDGYFRAGEDAREDLVAAGKWNSRPPPVVSGQPVEPRRRGRPPKDERR